MLLEGNRILDITIVHDFIRTLSCPTCSEELSLHERRFGLASKFVIACTDSDCDYKYVLYSSKKLNQQAFEINRLCPLAMYSAGCHYTASRRILSGLNLPPPQTRKSWTQHVRVVGAATKDIAEESMNRAADEVRIEGESDITVSCDGTWQRRGFASKNGVGTVLTVNDGSSKVIDTQTLSNYCGACATNKSRLSPEKFQDWKKGHSDCSSNHSGSAGAMEPAAMKTIFSRSEECRGLRYTGYLGDGDSKAYSSVVAADPYDGETINKLECCGHVQKRMGRRLMDKVQECKQKTYTYNGKTVKGIGGANKLTQKAIKSIQGHYGGAIRNNPGDKEGMNRAIWAIYNHRNRNHSDCPEWCPSKTGKGDPDKHALPPYVCEEIKPIFEALSSDQLLSKCTHGGTQNTNESYHNLIWSRCPKTSFVGRERLEIAVAEATIVYNDGEVSRLRVYERLGLTRSNFLTNELKRLDLNRLRNAYVSGDRSIILARRANRTQNSADKDTYGAGSF